jgi:hypothetical protein
MDLEKASHTSGFLGLVLQRRLLERPRVRGLVLAAGCVLIPLWQHSFAARPRRLDRAYAQLAASGLQYRGGVQAPTMFLYFYYYLGLFPVATELDAAGAAPRSVALPMSREGARQVIAEHGDTLVMEHGHKIRCGDRGQIWLYLPSMWLRGASAGPQVRFGDGIAFAVALMALFVAFWAVRQPVLGLFFVAFLGSNPFQLYEVYANENVFGWLITTGILVLALHLPLMGDGRPRRLFLWAVPIATGLLLGTARQVRPELPVLCVSAAAVCVLAKGLRWWERVAVPGVLVVALFATSRAWDGYFSRKFEQALQVVREAGGHPFTGPMLRYHTAWHTLWCGLGDFDTRYGYQWHDKRAKLYARPILAEKYGEIMPPWDPGKPMCDAWWDDAKKYYKLPHELPHYDIVVRDKVLHDVTHDPAWYLGILAQRAWRILTETTPVRLAWDGAWATLPMHGLVAIPLLGLLVWARAWFLVKLLLFFVPLSFVALLIYSGGGTCYYSAYHLAAAAVLAAVAFEWLLWARKRPRRPRRTPGAPPAQER